MRARPLIDADCILAFRVLAKPILWMQLDFAVRALSRFARNFVLAIWALNEWHLIYRGFALDEFLLM